MKLDIFINNDVIRELAEKAFDMDAAADKVMSFINDYIETSEKTYKKSLTSSMKGVLSDIKSDFNCLDCDDDGEVEGWFEMACDFYESLVEYYHESSCINSRYRYDTATVFVIDSGAGMNRLMEKGKSTFSRIRAIQNAITIMSKMFTNKDFISFYAFDDRTDRVSLFKEASKVDIEDIFRHPKLRPSDNKASNMCRPVYDAYEYVKSTEAAKKNVFFITDDYTSFAGGSELIRRMDNDDVYLTIVNPAESERTRYYKEFANSNGVEHINSEDPIKISEFMCECFASRFAGTPRQDIRKVYYAQNEQKDTKLNKTTKPEDLMGQATLKKKKGDNTMNISKIFGGNIQIGRMSSDLFKGSFGGLAIKAPNGGGYVSYDGESLTDVTDFTFDGDMTMALPAFTVGAGDLVMNGTTPVYVKKVNADGSIEVVNPTGEKIETILPKKTIFGFKVYIKIWSLFGQMMPKGIMGSFDINNPAAAGKQNPMAMMIPLMFSGMFSGNDDGEEGLGGILETILPMMILPQLMGGNASGNPFAGLFGGVTATDDDSNPMANIMQMFMPIIALSMLGNKKGDKDGGLGKLGELLPLMMIPQMMNGMIPQTQQKEVIHVQPKKETKRPSRSKEAIAQRAAQKQTVEKNQTEA